MPCVQDELMIATGQKNWKNKEVRTSQMKKNILLCKLLVMWKITLK